MGIDAIQAYNPFMKKINAVQGFGNNNQQPKVNETQGAAQPINFGGLTSKQPVDAVAPANARANFENGLAAGDQAGMAVSHNGKDGVAGSKLYLIG
ncbi:MAG: hypothetical protein PHV37_02855 [Candidatus Gastranaerophilales bacterium]|nr:hypothetical protein [Candidatus Gastranaerophilales bacterium]